ncbi:polyprenyl synthetase family protein [Mycobacteroides abscessus]|uniref:polyprenyl synthetase family protein n=1 Tax=Mycobacteroides abscessus TaxID=36809 RepID=UPI001D1456EF|nr:polyprenyl synthetase family protein [Mycobacteroides abscessus]UEA50905.1 polyprenyl synthetase family protein [Mycobacteroides abscessus subsp. abscessus]UEA55432.1 polyprenyl synthetase family protein [Mycobacteroides abscessus]
MTDAVSDQLSQFLAECREHTAHIGQNYEHAITALDRFVLRGGKRLRPAFAYWGWRAITDDPNPWNPEVLRVCAALELLHTCALIHDDVIDSSATRRGEPTIHVEFAALHRENGWSGSPEQFGISAAILLGDLALTWADDMVVGAQLSPDAHVRARGVWSILRSEVLGGQYLDILSESSGDESVETALRVIRFKTAGYTVQRPLQLGVAIAGENPEVSRLLGDVGLDIGVAFQLRDDVLGVFGDPKVTGKPAGDDLRSGKRTVLLAEALRLARQSDSAAEDLLHSWIGTPLTDQQVAEMCSLIVDLGALGAVESRIEEHTHRALDQLASADIAEDARAALSDLVRLVSNRSA